MGLSPQSSFFGSDDYQSFVTALTVFGYKFIQTINTTLIQIHPQNNCKQLMQILIYNLTMLENRITTLIVITMLFGSLNTISLKIQDNQNVTLNGSFTVRYFHPFILTVLLFVGQSMVYLLEVYVKRERQSWIAVLFEGEKKEDDDRKFIVDERGSKKPKAPLSQILVPTVLDIFTNVFANFALNLVDGSIWQLTKGGQIITTAILSKFLLKRIFTNRQIFGCSLAFFGITSVQFVSVMLQKQQTQDKGNSTLISLFLLSIALVCNSLSLIAEKDIFNKYQIEPLEMVYLEGFMGTVIMFLIAFAFQYVECPWEDVAQCVCIAPDECYLENFVSFLKGLYSNFLIFVLILGYLASIIATTSIGTILTKDVSPVARTMANMTRTIIVWIFNLLVTFALGSDPQYRLESLSFISNLSKFIGFCLLALGMFFYITKQPSPSVPQQNQIQLMEKQNKTPIQMENIQK